MDMSTLFPNEDIVDEFVEECIQPMFPYGSIMSRSSGIVPGHVKNPPIREVDFSQSNKSYVGSKYFFNGSYKFLHYTTLKGLMGILDSRQLRLYNLKYMDDPHEVSHVIEALSQTSKSEYMADCKRDGFYCLSMVKPIVEKSEKSIDLWRKYGDDGRGVAIELEFQKRQAAHWYQYHLSPVYYGKKDLVELQKWWNGCNEFMLRKRLSLTNLERAFQIVKACHKRAIYQSEKEVRLIYSLRGSVHVSDYKIAEKKRNDNDIHFDVSGNGNPTDYHVLDLESDKWKKFKSLEGLNATKWDLKKLYPQVKIKRVIFGYRFPRKEAGDLCRFIRENLDRKVLFCDSPLRKHFSSDYKEEDLYGFKQSKIRKSTSPIKISETIHRNR